MYSSGEMRFTRRHLQGSDLHTYVRLMFGTTIPPPSFVFKLKYVMSSISLLNSRLLLHSHTLHAISMYIIQQSGRFSIRNTKVPRRNQIQHRNSNNSNGLFVNTYENNIQECKPSDKQENYNRSVRYANFPHSRREWCRWVISS